MNVLLAASKAAADAAPGKGAACTMGGAPAGPLAMMATRPVMDETMVAYALMPLVYVLLMTCGSTKGG